jgi:hypothetical protein
MVELSAVNREAAGSIPTSGATRGQLDEGASGAEPEG